MGTHYLEARRARAAAAWRLLDEIVLVGSGEPVALPGHQDQTYPFRAHAEYFWLADRERPGCILAFDPREGWTDFVPRATDAQRVWEAVPPDEGTPVDAFEGWIAARRGRKVARLGAPVGVAADEALTARVREGRNEARRPKDEEELSRMRAAARATARGYEALRGLVRPGVTERALAIELEAGFFRAGAQRTAYGTIVATGPNSAVLHFAPSGRAARAGELVLVDAGAEVLGYACDVTRTYAADGSFTPEQRDLYAVVLEAQRNAIARCRPGTEWRDVHVGASVDLARGLADLGLLRGNAEDLVAQEAQTLFFPHGIGHMLGLGVRDAGGYLAGRKRHARGGLRYLRVDLPLREGFVMTVEPGIYFIPALLGNAAARERHSETVAWDRVDRMLGMGGIRIEDDVLVTAGEPEVLTAAIPK